jgi:NAD+ kinase
MRGIIAETGGHRRLGYTCCVPAPRFFNTLGIIGRADSPALPEVLPRLCAMAHSRGQRVVTDPVSARAADWRPDAVATLPELAAQVDLAVAAGGDGTLLGVARELVRHDVPLIGINLGRLGFLTDIPAEGCADLLGPVLDGEYLEEPRLILMAQVMRDGNVLHAGLAMNEVVIARGAVAAMIEFSVSVDDDFVYSLRADGLILATPTGSTAYALSAGGPILHPRLAAITLCPIAPQSLSNRPVTIPADVQVDVTLVRGDARANFDVQSNWELSPGDSVRVRAFERPLRLLHPRSYSYYATLRGKLHWNDRPA